MIILKIARDVREYLFREELEIKVYLNKVDIVNYKELGHFDSNKVNIYHNEGRILITGSNLVVSRLLNDEVLITGKISKIELGD